MRKEERKERNDRQDTEKRKRRMEKKHMRDANGKPKLCKKKKKNGHKIEKNDQRRIHTGGDIIIHKEKPTI